MWHGTYAWDRVAGTKLTWTWAFVALPCHMAPLYGPSHFKQLDMKGHVLYSRVSAIISVWIFRTEFSTKMVNLNNLLLTFTLN